MGAPFQQHRRRNIMLDWMKSVWAKWKIQVTVVGGVLVVATAYGTCSVDPATVSDNTTIGETTNSIEVSSTTATETASGGTTEGGTTTETTGETTTTTETTTTE